MSAYICRLLCLCITLSLFSLNDGSQGQDLTNFKYARCDEGEGSCRDCYAALVGEVLGSDENVFNLNKAFFPPRTNPAEFVVIIYHYENESMDESVTWFWTEQSSYFLHPLHTFQFLSLFFGKPEAFYTQEAEVTLNASTCFGVDNSHLELLTQRLKAYVQKQDIFASIDNSYSAKAVSSAVLDEILQSHGQEITEIIVCLQCLLIFFVGIGLIAVTVVHGCSHKWPKALQKLPTVNKYFRQKQATIMSVVIVSFLIILHIIALDSVALYRRGYPINLKILDIHNEDQSCPPSALTLLYEIPGMVLAFDLFGALFWLAMIVVSIILFVCPCEKCYTCDNTFFFLCISNFGLICCVVTHSPFIAIAYLNDAYHAGSIFIYYTIIILVVFAVTEKSIASCVKKSGDKFRNIIQLKGEWTLKGHLHVLSLDNDQKEIQLKLSGTDSKISVNSGQAKVEFKNIDSEIILDIEKGTLNFDGRNKITKDFITKLSQQKDKTITLAAKDMPTVTVSVQSPPGTFTFSGLKPTEGQRLKIHQLQPQGDPQSQNGNEVDERHRDQPKHGSEADEHCNKICIKFTQTKLTLQKAGQLQSKPFCRHLLQSKPFCRDLLQSKLFWCTVLLIVVGLLCILSILATVAILTSYFVIIPINRSISDAPNRLIGIYQSAIILVGAYIAYKAFFKAKKYLESSVVNRQSPLLSQDSKDRWKDMSQEEKLAQFYDVIVDIIVDKKSECQIRTDKQEGNPQSQNGNEEDEQSGDNAQSDPGQLSGDVAHGQQLDSGPLGHEVRSANDGSSTHVQRVTLDPIVPNTEATSQSGDSGHNGNVTQLAMAQPSPAPTGTTPTVTDTNPECLSPSNLC